MELISISQPIAERKRGLVTSRPQSSRLHSRVSAALQQLGVRHTNEQEVLGGVCYIDIAVQGGIAIEVDISPSALCPLPSALCPPLSTLHPSSQNPHLGISAHFNFLKISSGQRLKRKTLNLTGDGDCALQ
jgi:hypothetical protein